MRGSARSTCWYMTARKMCKRPHGFLESHRKDIMEFFGKEYVVGIDGVSERSLELKRSQRELVVVVRDVLVLILTAGHEWRVNQ